jgi:pSer/pThr/pTyr-binding forkhead associated (FHA) protein
MVNSKLTEYLQFQSQEQKSGCLHIKRAHEQGRVFLQHGQVVHAETEHGMGMFALFSLLGWGDAEVQWKEGEPAPRIAFEESVPNVLVQMAQLEDNGKTDEATLKSLFDQRPTEEIKLVNLSHYEITFEVCSSDLKGKTFKLSKPSLLIGRADNCDFILPDGTVSGHHCLIAQEVNCVRATDLGSTNGTRINGTLISDSILRVGDELMVGQVVLKMSMKLKRHLDNALSVASGTKSIPTNISKRLPTAQIGTRSGSTIRMAAKPISWKTIQEDKTKTKTQTKSAMGDILGKMFNNPKK